MATPQPTDFKSFIGIFTDLIALALPIVSGLALLAFLWGLSKFIFNVQGDAKAVAEGKNLMIWGVIALFIMVSVWGLVSFLSNEFGLGADLVLPLLPS